MIQKNREDVMPILPRGLRSITSFVTRIVHEFGVLPLISVAIIWIVLIPLLIPRLDWDRGIFVSVAERLLAGDILYEQVFDNKEPFFYYFVALQRAIGPIAELAAEIFLLILTAISAYFLALRLSTKRTAIVTAFVAVPIILTGGFYSPGYSHLPGVGLCLAAYALSIRGKLTLSGIVVGILLFTKLIMVPLAVSLVICATAFEHLPSSASCARRFLIALGLTVLLGSALLVFRSEFWPFVDTLFLNASYAQGALLQTNSIGGSLVAHLIRISSVHLAVSLPSIAVGILTTWVAKPTGDRALTAMASTASLALAISLGILATTGLWDQHNQVLYVPATLVAICLSRFLGAVFYRGRGVVWLALVVCVALLLGGVKHPKHYPFDVVNQISRLSSLSPEAQRLLAVGVSGSYARLGGNIDDQGHAFGLKKWALICARFHQYPFESEQILDKVLVCASSAPTLVVAESLASSEGWPIWNRFVRNIEDLLSSSYSCDAKTGLRICRRIMQ